MRSIVATRGLLCARHLDVRPVSEHVASQCGLGGYQTENWPVTAAVCVVETTPKGGRLPLLSRRTTPEAVVASAFGC